MTEDDKLYMLGGLVPDDMRIPIKVNRDGGVFLSEESIQEIVERVLDALEARGWGLR